MAIHGQVSGGLELMRQENQVAAQPAWHMMPQQQATLSFAWMVLKGMEQRESFAQQSPAVADSAGPSNAAFCASCGTRRSSGLHCTNCGARFS
jgi:hypothetical protein